MFSKIVCLAALVAAVYGQADKYPAGVSPHLCPNYPLCDNSALAYNTAPAPAPVQQYNYNPAPQFQYAPAPAPAPVPQYRSAAAQYPAGVNPASCPNYPYCSNAGSAAPAPPLPGFSARLYPDGISPSTCPNYPYCN